MENNQIYFDQVDGCITFTFDKDIVSVLGENERDGTYFHGKFSKKKLKKITTIKDSVVLVKCDDENEEDIKKRMLDFIFINYEKGNSELYGFILLGVERKLLIEIPSEEYWRLKDFLEEELVEQ